MKKQFLWLAAAVLFTACEAAPKPSELKAMTFNIRYDNPADSANNWKYRRGAVVDMIRDLQPGVLGIQEGLAHQVAYLDSALTDYAYVGVGRDDGKQAGEYAAIFYNDSLYSALESGNFWLSATPDSASFGWDAACIRIATWVKLEERATGKRFLCLNTHFDHIGKVARTESAKMIAARSAELADSLPFLIMGDFNSSVSDPALLPLVQNPALRELRATASARPDSLVDYTFQGFRSRPGRVPRECIDHIFYSSGFTPLYYAVVTEGYGVPFLSDHFPVWGRWSF